MSNASDRLNIRLTGTSPAILQDLTAEGQTPSEVVRRALSLLHLHEQEKKRGYHFEVVADGDAKDRARLHFL